MTADEWTEVPDHDRLVGDEQFAGTNFAVLDFWRFAMPDLKMNNTRGYLAEFLVARAVGAPHGRIEWDAYDVMSPEGIRIEVKSSAYVQAWAQRRPSTITFTSLTGRTWTPKDGSAHDRTLNADVYVFCLQIARTHEDYDPLDVAQWEFYVLPRSVLETRAQRSIGLATLERLTPSVPFEDLAAVIRAAI